MHVHVHVSQAWRPGCSPCPQGCSPTCGGCSPTYRQAIAEAGLVDEFPQMCSSAFSYLERTQILCSAAARASDAFGFEGPAMRRRYFRHVSEGKLVR